ncbi:uncharacterized protein LOC131289251 [Anopheles ziemanni]|uniref:uncharacterized protein LOC131261042 n=1 Tax=Anopheles coustani TaxID=139045 RepID=UPI002657B510|nr:uncharacterized protein LOC131261042 [Anopheles coustani]XP_058174451.1 uncharacterized protein LOC131289251 [Anopheles ziemanni]
MCDTLMINMPVNRKRLRSNDSDVCFAMQRKTFVSQHMMDQQDASKMKQIQAKTISLLFQGAKKQSKAPILIDRKEALRSVRLLGGGEIDFDVGAASSWIEKKPDRKCRLCDRMAIIHVECTNCNLELCEYCGINCSNCPEKICMNCVNIFHCERHEKPCCDQCKMFVL